LSEAEAISEWSTTEEEGGYRKRRKVARKKRETDEQRMLKKNYLNRPKKHYSIFRELIQDRGIKVNKLDG